MPSVWTELRRDVELAGPALGTVGVGDRSLDAELVRARLEVGVGLERRVHLLPAARRVRQLVLGRRLALPQGRAGERHTRRCVLRVQHALDRLLEPTTELLRLRERDPRAIAVLRRTRQLRLERRRLRTALL